MPSLGARPGTAESEKAGVRPCDAVLTARPVAQAHSCEKRGFRTTAQAMWGQGTAWDTCRCQGRTRATRTGYQGPVCHSEDTGSPPWLRAQGRSQAGPGTGLMPPEMKHNKVVRALCWHPACCSVGSKLGPWAGCHFLLAAKGWGAGCYFLG